MASPRSSVPFLSGDDKPQILGNAQPSYRSPPQNSQDAQSSYSHSRARTVGPVTRKYDHCPVSLHVGDAVKVFSNSANAWMLAKVVDIAKDEEQVNVEYVVAGDLHQKSLTRTSKNLRNSACQCDVSTLTFEEHESSSRLGSKDQANAEVVSIELLEQRLEARLLEKVQSHIEAQVEKKTTAALKQVELHMAEYMKEYLQCTSTPLQKDVAPAGVCSNVLGSSLDDNAQEAAPTTPLRGRLSLLLSSMGKAGLDEVKFKPSMWDATLLLGPQLYGFANSAILVLILIITMGLLTILSGAVMYNFTYPKYNSEVIDHLRHWRIHFSSMFSEVDRTGTSLYHRVCAQDTSVITSSPQADIYSSLSDYRPSSPDLSGRLFSGPAVCAMALILWYFTLIKELRATLSLCWALLCLPAGPTTLTLDNAGVQLTHMSCRRKVLVCSVTTVRLLVCAILACSGTLFLVYTEHIQDLILNCVALEVILNVDEMAFAALAPLRAHLMLDAILPVSLPISHRRRMRHAWSAFWLAAVTISFILIVMQVLDPYIQVLFHARHTLCGGGTVTLPHRDRETGWFYAGKQQKPCNIVIAVDEDHDIYHVACWHEGTPFYQLDDQFLEFVLFGDPQWIEDVITTGAVFMWGPWTVNWYVDDWEVSNQFVPIARNLTTWVGR